MRPFIRYADAEVPLGNLSELLSRAVKSDILMLDKELLVESPSVLSHQIRHRNVAVCQGGSQYESEEDLDRIPIANPSVFTVQFDGFALLKEVPLAIADGFDVRLANNGDMDPTPGKIVATRIRSDPSWNLDHLGTLPE